VKPGAAILTGEPWFSLANPGIVSIPLGFLGAIVGTLLSKKKADQKKFEEIVVKANIGM
jgi:cation/acetate symporter